MGAGSGIERRLLDAPRAWFGAIAQLGERVLCKHEVVGSIPSGSTIFVMRAARILRVGRQRISVFEETSVPL